MEKIVFVCGGMYPKKDAPREREFLLVCSTGGPPYVADDPANADLMFYLCQHHSSLYQVNLETGEATRLRPGEAFARDPYNDPRQLAMPESLLEQVRAQVRSGNIWAVCVTEETTEETTDGSQ